MQTDDSVSFISTLFLIAAASLLTIRILTLWQRRPIHRDGKTLLPLPGPLQLPILGNALQIPTSYTWRTYAAWSHKYGPIYQVRRGSETIVILGSARVVNDLLEKRASIYSCRPIINAASGGGLSVSMTPYGDKFRAHRKIMQPGLSRASMSRYRQGLQEESRVLALQLLEEPEKFAQALERYTGSSILKVVYGRKLSVLDRRDEDLIELHKVNEYFFTALKPSGSLANVATSLGFTLPSWLGSGGADAQDWADRELRLFRKLLDGAREKLACGEDPSCFAHVILSMQEGQGLTDDEAAYVAGSMYGAGAESTASTLEVCIMACALYPQAARQAREELDSIVGDSRMPTWSDFEKMPHVQRFLLEALRWRPFVPGGMSHRVTQDDDYEGYHIPAGATVLGNVESLHMDAAAFGSDSHLFRPSRFDNVNCQSEDELLDAVRGSNKRIYPFGFGRRVCPGLHLGLASLGTALPVILWGFDIQHARDPHTGQEIPIDPGKFRDTVGSRPLPFRCSITPRSARRAKVMRDEERSGA